MIDYLASPYTNHPRGMLVAYQHAVEAARMAQEQGYEVFSPIVHFHPMSTLSRNPESYDYWMERCRPFMAVSRRLIILMDEGWKDSTGMKTETVEMADRPLLYMEWPTGEIHA